MTDLKNETEVYINRVVLRGARCLVVAVDDAGTVTSLDDRGSAWSVAGLAAGEPLPLELGAINDCASRDEAVQVFPKVYVGDADVLDVHVLTRQDGRRVILHDISERHAAEVALQQTAHQIALLLEKQAELNRELDIQRATAEQASKAKSRFIASMSHEFRTPITSIMGYVDLLNAGHDSPNVKNAITRASWHLVALVENLLEHARGDSSAVPLNFAPVDLQDVLQTVEFLFLREAEAKGLQLRVVGPAGPVSLETDALRLQQVLINLLGNALRYTPSGSIELAVTTTRDRVVFRVSDTGPGIGPEDQQRIFEPFTRLNPGQGTGAGLGLAISRQLVMAMGGELRLESVPGQGATFRFELPHTDAAMVRDRPDLSGRRALVVDDDPDILDLFELLLGDMGLDVTSASSLQQAVQQAERQDFDLLLTDFHLDEGNGADLMQAVRAQQPKCRTILCSGSGLSGKDRRNARELADELLSKPIQPERLMAVVERVLRREA